MKNISSIRKILCPICFSRLRLIDDKDYVINYQSFLYIKGHKYKKIIKKIETSNEIYFISKLFKTKSSDVPIKKVTSISFKSNRMPDLRVKINKTFLNQKTVFDNKYKQKYYAHICSNENCSYYMYIDEITK